jgi:serine/threonine-protein kinase
MSPEQAKGARHIDQRSDLYAVGVILYECVTGQIPFEAQTLNELIFRIVLEAPPPVESLVPDIDPAFAAILRKAMAREIGERFQTAREMHDALSQWLSPGHTPAGLGLDTSSALLWASAPNRHRGRRTSERTIVAGLLATLALGGVTLFAVRPHGPDATMTPSALPPPAAAVQGAAAPAIETTPATLPPSAPTASAVAMTPAPAPPAARSGTPRARSTRSTGVARPAAAPAPKPAAVVPAKRTVPDEL